CIVFHFRRNLFPHRRLYSDPRAPGPVPMGGKTFLWGVFLYLWGVQTALCRPLKTRFTAVRADRTHSLSPMSNSTMIPTQPMSSPKLPALLFLLFSLLSTLPLAAADFTILDEFAGPPLVGFGAQFNGWIYCKPNWSAGAGAGTGAGTGMGAG